MTHGSRYRRRSSPSSPATMMTRRSAIQTIAAWLSWARISRFRLRQIYWTKPSKYSLNRKVSKLCRPWPRRPIRPWPLPRAIRHHKAPPRIATTPSYPCPSIPQFFAETAGAVLSWPNSRRTCLWRKSLWNSLQFNSKMRRSNHRICPRKLSINRQKNERKKKQNKKTTNRRRRKRNHWRSRICDISRLSRSRLRIRACFWSIMLLGSIWVRVRMHAFFSVSTSLRLRGML